MYSLQVKVTLRHIQTFRAPQIFVLIHFRPTYFRTGKVIKKHISLEVDFSACDLYGTNFYKSYRKFEEIGLLQVGAVFNCLHYFGLDVLLGINAKYI